MKTTELIDLLASDLRPLPSLGLVLTVGATCGTLIAAMAFAAMIGIRPDIGAAITSERFVYKLTITLSLLASAAVLLKRTGRPGMSLGGRQWLLSLPVVLVAAGVLAELIANPPEAWATLAMGRNALKCLAIIPLLSVAPLGCLVHALRLSAPGHPGLAGVVAGLMAGAISATLYALHCDDDSPLFILSWYLPAIAIVVLVGYGLGNRLLRW
jgi:hypothetical protein